MPLLALSRDKMTDKEKEKEKKNIIRDIVSQKKERQCGFLLRKKEKKKKEHFFGTWYLRKKKKKRYTCEPLFSWREEVVTSFPVL